MESTLLWEPGRAKSGQLLDGCRCSSSLRSFLCAGAKGLKVINRQVCFRNPGINKRMIAPGASTLREQGGGSKMESENRVSPKIRFFGDRCEEGGNDYSLAIAIAEKHFGYAFKVDNYKEVWDMLKKKTHA